MDSVAHGSTPAEKPRKPLWWRVRAWFNRRQPRIIQQLDLADVPTIQSKKLRCNLHAMHEAQLLAIACGWRVTIWREGTDDSGLFHADIATQDGHPITTASDFKPTNAVVAATFKALRGRIQHQIAS